MIIAVPFAYRLDYIRPGARAVLTSRYMTDTAYLSVPDLTERAIPLADLGARHLKGYAVSGGLAKCDDKLDGYIKYVRGRYYQIGKDIYYAPYDHKQPYITSMLTNMPNGGTSPKAASRYAIHTDQNDLRLQSQERMRKSMLAGVNKNEWGPYSGKESLILDSSTRASCIEDMQGILRKKVIIEGRIATKTELPSAVIGAEGNVIITDARAIFYDQVAHPLHLLPEIEALHSKRCTALTHDSLTAIRQQVTLYPALFKLKQATEAENSNHNPASSRKSRQGMMRV